MIFVVPLAYIGASWYNGEDGVANIKEFLGIESNTTTVEERPVNPPLEEDRSTYTELLQETEYYKKRVDELEAENKRLQEQVWQLQQDISRLNQN